MENRGDGGYRYVMMEHIMQMDRDQGLRPFHSICKGSEEGENNVKGAI